MLEKRHRLKTKTDFDLVYKNGRSVKTTYFNFIYVKNRGQKDIPEIFKLPRFGFVASKKVGGAVKRNRAKRLLREAVRNELPKLSNTFEAVFIAFDTASDAEYSEILKKVQEVFKREDLYKML